MGIANIGIPGLILIVTLALIVFGPKKLPEIGKAAGQTLREFKTATSGIINEDDAVTNNSEVQAKLTDENK